MIKRGMFEERSVGSQLFILLLIFFFCLCISMLPMLIVHALAPDPSAPAVLRTNLLIQDLFLFILTSLWAHWVLFKERAAVTFSLRGAPVSVFLAGIASILVINGAVDYLNEWNQGLQLPEWLAGLQLKMEAYERSAELILSRLLDDTRWSVLGYNLFLIAGMAALGEELLFRGLIQKLFYRWTGQTHTAVWVTALIFSAVHLQFFGFIPRMLLGALLGYLLVYSGSLWVCIAAHFFNNALTVLALPGQPYNTQWEWTHTLHSFSATPLIAVISLSLSVLCIGYIRWIGQQRQVWPFNK